MAFELVIKTNGGLKINHFAGLSNPILGMEMTTNRTKLIVKSIIFSEL